MLFFRNKKEDAEDVDDVVESSSFSWIVVGFLIMLMGLAIYAALITLKVFYSPEGVLEFAEGNFFGLLGNWGAYSLLFASGLGGWMIGGIMWWYGFYMLIHRGDFPNRVMWGGVGVWVFACMILGIQPFFGESWSENMRILGAGGALGYYLGAKCFFPLLGFGGALILLLCLYASCFIFMFNVSLLDFVQGLKEEGMELWMKWRVSVENRREKKRKRLALLAQKKAEAQAEESLLKESIMTSERGDEEHILSPKNLPESQQSVPVTVTPILSKSDEAKVENHVQPLHQKLTLDSKSLIEDSCVSEVNVLNEIEPHLVNDAREICAEDEAQLVENVAEESSFEGSDWQETSVSMTDSLDQNDWVCSEPGVFDEAEESSEEGIYGGSYENVHEGNSDFAEVAYVADVEETNEINRTSDSFDNEGGSKCVVTSEKENAEKVCEEDSLSMTSVEVTPEESAESMESLISYSSALMRGNQSEVSLTPDEVENSEDNEADGVCREPLEDLSVPAEMTSEAFEEVFYDESLKTNDFEDGGEDLPEDELDPMQWESVDVEEGSWDQYGEKEGECFENDLINENDWDSVEHDGEEPFCDDRETAGEDVEAGDLMSQDSCALNDLDVQKVGELKSRIIKAPSSFYSSEFDSYVLPSIDLLNSSPKKVSADADRLNMLDIQDKIISTLKSFHVQVSAGDITRGPTVTRYEIYPSVGLPVSRITKYEQDIARATSAESISIQAPIPGRDTVGIEIANTVENRVTVDFKDLLIDKSFTESKMRIPVALGKNIYGQSVVADLAAMPHLLVAGSTGSGKSVTLNCIIASMLYKFKPDELKLILVDPKVVEMMFFRELPHLIVPVVTDPKKVLGAMRWCVNEMEHRYQKFGKLGVRNIDGYNSYMEVMMREASEREVRDKAVQAAHEAELSSDRGVGSTDPSGDFEGGELPLMLDDHDTSSEPKLAKMPYIVIVVDELADLMQTVGKDLENYIVRLTQKARAAGIHLIVATQSPRTTVVTGLIKANIPCRLALRVASLMDSRVILDRAGAEKLVSKGDFLFVPPGSAQLERAQGAFISEPEMERIVKHCSDQAKPDFHEEAQNQIESAGDDSESDLENEADAADLERCIEVIRQEQKASASLLQRRLRFGYAKAARMMDILESKGYVGPSESPSKPRDVFI